MKNPVDIAETLVEAADKLPDLVFSKTGELIKGTPSTAPKKPGAKASSAQGEPARRPRRSSRS